MRRKRAEEGGSIDVVTTTDKTPSGCSRLTQLQIIVLRVHLIFELDLKAVEVLVSNNGTFSIQHEVLH